MSKREKQRGQKRGKNFKGGRPFFSNQTGPGHPQNGAREGKGRPRTVG